MQLIPLGCSAGMPSRGVASSGYLVDDGSTRIMLDCGPGTAVALSRYLPERSIDALFVSHLHTDHVLDALAIGKMLLARRLQPDGSGSFVVDPSTSPVPLFAPLGAAERLRALAAIFPVTTHSILDKAFELGFTVTEYRPGDTFEVGDLTLHVELMDHAEPDCGIRVDGPDGSLVYSGDTRATSALVALAEGCGTLLVESTLAETDATEHGHLASWEAGRAARDAGAAELVLTHQSPLDAESREWHRRRAADEFGGPVSLAEPFYPHHVPAGTRSPIS